ncbi:MAG: hypothetical protein LUC22_03055 [Prevotella sp.]|nr:hypothetical protein [Prevotella sp.]
MTLEEAREEYGELFDFYKNKPSDKTYWTAPLRYVGVFLLSFDEKHVYNLFADIPGKLSNEEFRLFLKENPYWRRRFGKEIKELDITF